MKLNPDCIRDILMYVEEQANGKDYVYINEQEYMNYDLLKKYDYATINYHVLQCNENGFFLKYSRFYNGNQNMFDLSPEGHDFLDKIRSDNNWNKIKKILTESGSFSLKTLFQVAMSNLLAP